MILLIKGLCNEENNDSGENVAFQAEAKCKGLGLNFKFTVHQTPQQNGQVECKFATLFRRVCTMLNLVRLLEKQALG